MISCSTWMIKKNVLTSKNMVIEMCRGWPQTASPKFKKILWKAWVLALIFLVFTHCDQVREIRARFLSVAHTKCRRDWVTRVSDRQFDWFSATPNAIAIVIVMCFHFKIKTSSSCNKTFVADCHFFVIFSALCFPSRSSSKSFVTFFSLSIKLLLTR